jgi:hypothetical protein
MIDTEEQSITEVLLGVPPAATTATANDIINERSVAIPTRKKSLQKERTFLNQLRRIGSKEKVDLEKTLDTDIPIFLSIPDFSLDKRASGGEEDGEILPSSPLSFSNLSKSSYVYGSQVRPIFSRERNALKQAALALPPLIPSKKAKSSIITGAPTKPNQPKVYDRRPTTITVHFTIPFDTNYMEPELIGFEVHVARTKLDLELGNGIRRALVIKGKPPPTIITDIIPSATYCVRVRTQWSGGWSHWSAPTKIDEFTPTRPMKPDVIVLPKSISINIHVNVPSDGRDDGLIISKHEIIVWSNHRIRYPSGKFEFKKVIEYNPIEQLKIGSNECRKCSIEITKGILTRTKYNIEVRSQNNAGWSDTYIECITTPTSDGPPAPTNITLVSQTNSSITFQWDCCRGIANLKLVQFEMQIYTGDGIHIIQRDKIKIKSQEGREAGLGGGDEKQAPVRANTTKTYSGTITNVQPSTRLMFAVKVKNTNHWSNPSVKIPFLSKAPRFPSWNCNNNQSPIAIGAVHADNDDQIIKLCWLPPDDDGGATLTGLEMKVKEIPDDLKEEATPAKTNKSQEKNVVIFPIKSKTREVMLRGMWPDTNFDIVIRGRNRRGWGKWSKIPLTIRTSKMPMPHDTGAFVEAWWNGPWLHRPGYYLAIVKSYRPRRKRRRNQLGEPGLYTLISKDYPDNEFKAYDYQVRATGSYHGKLPLSIQKTKRDIYQEYVDFFPYNDPNVEKCLHDSSSDEYQSSESDDNDYRDESISTTSNMIGMLDELHFQGNQRLSSFNFGTSSASSTNGEHRNSVGGPYHFNQMKTRLVTKDDVIRALTPPAESFLSSFHKVGSDKRTRVRGKKRQTGDSIWWKSK